MSAAAPRRRALLLDVFARADGFVGDEGLRMLAARIERAGHEARIHRSTLGEDGGGDAAAWHARLAGFTRDAGPWYVVGLPRVWDAALLDALRPAAPGARFVRLSAGVTARLDDRFDHVLDDDGLLALLDGDERPPPAAWSKMTPRELRQRVAARLEVIAPAATAPASLPLADEAVPGLGRRPTITGPAAGCPFLLDARGSAIYRDLAVDETRVQMRGCTFCLDNIGTYAAPSTDAMVGSWMAQLRAIRAQRPLASPLEVLCTDERPHPYLPALFAAIAAEPDLGRIELLIKSRVDWLLEFADTAVADACTIAERAGCVLHVYLVGFESFDPFHLELFNKGVSVEENVHAIEKLRDLSRRFPRSLEYLRYRAHGVVLFTPWTRPEHLLENARVMRQVRFHELRSEALRTRLRLYPRVPLHALAARDGLLVEEFAEGRGDRAAEQGYDASAPWRFADERVEAIFRVANLSLLRDRGYRDADVLEAATRYVLRWPGLAAAPDLAPIAFERAVLIWAPPVEVGDAEDGAGVTSLGFDPEIDGIAAGVKDACLKEGVPATIGEPLVRAYRAMGLAAGVVTRHGISAQGDVHGVGEDFAIVAVARDEETLAQVVDAQRAHRGRDEEAARRMGRLMGYPSCCVEAFLAQRSRADNLENERWTFRRAPGEPLHPLLNRFAVVRLTSHHPCTPSCSASVAMAERLLARLAELDAGAARWVRAQVAEAVLVLDYASRLALAGAWEGDAFRVDGARPLDDARKVPVPVAGIARVSVTQHDATFVYHDGRIVKLDVRQPILATPGIPLAPAARAAIAPPPEADGPPPLPGSVHRGARFLGYSVVSIEPVRDGGHGLAHRVALAQGEERLVLRLRPHDPARPQALRRGAWAIDVEGAAPLPERARAALVLLARTIPA